MKAELRWERSSCRVLPAVGRDPRTTCRSPSEQGQTSKSFFFFVCIWVSCLHACMYVYHVCPWCPRRPKEGIESPGTGVTDSASHQVGAGRQIPRSSGRTTISRAPSSSLEFSPAQLLWGSAMLLRLQGLCLPCYHPLSLSPHVVSVGFRYFLSHTT